MDIYRSAAAAFFAVATIGGAHAQGIERKGEAYVGTLPIAPAASQSQPAPTVVTAPPIAPAAQIWDIQLKDINFANVFHRWASKAGYRIRWDAQKHFLVEAPDSVAGSFEEAVNIVLESPGIAQSAYPLEVCIYPNTPPLARITRRGEQDKECK